MSNGSTLDQRQQALRPNTKLTLLALLIVALGVAAGVASSQSYWYIPLAVLGGLAVFALIYWDLQIGIALFVLVNVLLPQAGPSLSLGIQTPVGERGIHFNVQEIIMAMVLAAWLIQAFFKKASWKERSPMIIPIVLYVLTSILACFIGLINDARPLIVIFRFMRTVFLAYIFFVILNNVRNRKQFTQLIVILLICTTLVAGLGLVQKAMGLEWSENFAEVVLDSVGYPEDVNYVSGGSTTEALRVNSTMIHPNILGAFLVFVLPFFISLLWLYKRLWMRLLLLAGLGINLACIFYTGSRAAWIAAIAIAILYFFFAFMDRRMLLVVVTLAIVLLLLFVLINPPGFVRSRFTGHSATTSVKYRTYQYKIAFDFFLAHPLFGIGMGMEGERLDAGYTNETWAAVEDLYLTYLVSHGLVGLIPLLLIFLVYWGMLFIAWRRSRADPYVRYHSEAFLLGMVGIAVAALFAAWLLFFAPIITLWWFFIGMAAVVYNFSKDRGEGEPVVLT